MTGHVTPSVILIAIIGFFAGAISLAFNPFFAVSVVGVGLGWLTLRSAAGVNYYLAQGLLRIAGVLAVMSGLGGAVALAFPGLGVRTA